MCFLFEENDFNSFPVVQNGRLIRVFGTFDFMRAFAFTEDHPLPDYEFSWLLHNRKLRFSIAMKQLLFTSGKANSFARSTNIQLNYSDATFRRFNANVLAAA